MSEQHKHRSTPTKQHRNVRSYISVDRDLERGSVNHSPAPPQSNRLKKQHTSSRAYHSHDNLLVSAPPPPPPPAPKSPPYYFGDMKQYDNPTYQHTTSYSTDDNGQTKSSHYQSSHHDVSGHPRIQNDSNGHLRSHQRGQNDFEDKLGLNSSSNSSQRVQSRVSKTYESSQHFKGTQLCQAFFRFDFWVKIIWIPKEVGRRKGE